jgi:uncharacterized membrane protein
MDHDRARRLFKRNHDPARVMALSDGVFAIIITLLVLEIRVPDLTGDQRLAEALSEIRPSFVAFLISFLVVAISWTGHRDLFAFIRLTDRYLVWLNVLYMLPLSLLPFGAALLARYGQERVALTLYGFLLLAIALTRLFIWVYATNRPRLMSEPIDRRSRRRGALLVLLPAALYVLAILFAGTAPIASLWIYAGAPILYFVALIVTRTAAPPEAVEQNAASPER